MKHTRRHFTGEERIAMHLFQALSYSIGMALVLISVSSTGCSSDSFEINERSIRRVLEQELLQVPHDKGLLTKNGHAWRRKPTNSLPSAYSPPSASSFGTTKAPPNPQGPYEQNRAAIEEANRQLHETGAYGDYRNIGIVVALGAFALAVVMSVRKRLFRKNAQGPPV